jgi:phosphate transport system ATP-binding protein
MNKDGSMNHETMKETKLSTIPVAARPEPSEQAENVALDIRNFSLFYGKFQALGEISLSIFAHRITAIIGPSGCGKSTLLRSINRMNDLVPNVHIEGEILLDGHLCTRGRRGQPAPASRHGLPAAQPFPQEHLR